MLGLGSNLISGVYIEAAAVTPTIGLGATTFFGSFGDENVGIIQALTADLPDVTGVSAHARVAGLEGNVTITHTHGDGGVALDPVVAETVTLYAYRFAGANAVYLTELTAGSYTSFASLDITTINSGSIAAEGDGDIYTCRVNFMSKSGFNNSTAGSLKTAPIDAA